MRSSKRIVSIMLVFSMLCTIFPSYVFANDRANLYLEERVIDESALTDDLFYIGTESAYIAENANTNYLFKVGRGGEAKEATTVEIKMIDVTAKYGKDYKVRIHNGTLFDNKVNNPKNNESVLETFLNNPDEIEEQTNADIPLEELDGLTEPIISTTMSAITQIQVEVAEEVEEIEEVKEVKVQNEPRMFTTPAALSPIKAKEIYTGKASDRVSMDGSDQLQEQIQGLSADYINSFSGATLELDFAEGETFKYIEIEAIDNHIGDGERVFQVVINTPSSSVENSIYGSMVIKIEDDEVQEEAKVSFTQGSYHSEDGFIKIELERTNAMNQMVGVTLKTEDLSAESGTNYAQTNTSVVFPYGISKRTIHIPVKDRGLGGTGEFKVILVDPVGCEISGDETAICYIAKEDEIEGQDLTELQLFSSAEANVNSIMTGNKINLGKEAFSAGVWHKGSSYLSGDKWIMNPTTTKYDYNEAYVHFGLNGRQYVYSGFQVDWKLASGKPAYPTTEFKANSGGWKVLYDTTNERWNSKLDNIFLKDDYATSIRVSVTKRAAPLWRNPELTVNSIRPIKRPFEVSLHGADQLTFLTENGTKLANRPQASQVTLEGSASNGKAIKFDGDTVTITSSSDYSYIKGLRIVHKTTGASKEIMKNLSPGTTSVSFDLNNTFITNNLSFVTFGNNGNNGRKGEFKIQAIMGYVDAKVEIASDKKGNIKVVNDKNANTNGKNGYHLGDVICIGTDINDAYKAMYQSTEVRFRSQLTMNAKERDFREKYDPQKGYVIMPLQAVSTRIDPVFVKLNNQVVVRIPKNQKDDFDLKQGIFLNNNPRTVGEYLEYVVVLNKEFSTGKYYEFTAKTKANSGKVAQWQRIETNNMYSQETFYYQPDEDVENNVIYLKAATATSDNFRLTGSATYTDTSLDGSVKSSAWLKADGVIVSVGDYKTITDYEGTISTALMKGVTGNYVRYKLEASGMEQYKTVRLNQNNKTSQIITENNKEKTIAIYDNSVGNLEVAAINKQVPHLDYVSAFDSNLVQNGNQIYINSKPVTLQASINNDNKKYTDHSGKIVEEKVTAVDFVVYDPHTKEQRKVLTGAVKTLTGKDSSTWQLPATFDPVDTQLYKPSDRIYAMIRTDRVIGSGQSIDADGKLMVDPALQETQYAPIFTGWTFLYENPKEPVTQDINIPTNLDGLGLDKIPLIGDMVATFNVKFVSLSVTALGDGSTRLSVGAMPKTIPSTADNGVNYGAKEIKKAIQDIKDIGRDSSNKGALLVDSWGLYPIFGLYMDFGKKDVTEEHHQEKRYKYLFMGGGLYLGVSGKFKLTTYFIISYVPCYFGVNGEITMFLNGGITIKNADTVTWNSLIEESNSLDIVPQFALQANTTVQAYVGTGLNGTLGIRGGIEGIMQYIYHPTIKDKYPNHPVHGVMLQLGVRVWVDALIFTIPIPVYTVNKPYGYYDPKAAEEGRKSQAGTYAMGDGLDDMENTQVTMKLRDTAPSNWLPGASFMDGRRLAPGASKVILEGGYDRAEPQLMDLGNDRVLMTFIDDDKTRSSDNRTVLKYSIYENGEWSYPKVIQDDGTADFQPNLCDAGDSIMISWTSRDPKASDIDPIAYVQSMEVYTVLLDKSSTQIGKIERLTDDNFLDGDPTGLYDPTTGDRMVYYIKSDVKGDFEQTVSPTKNDSVIVYMLYDSSKGEWARTYYYENEVEDIEDQEQLIEDWGGQRFLASPIDAFNMNDPVIMDFNAISYNGLGVYTYTIDADNNIETNADRELFIQVYDFKTHKTYKPIRVTQDNVADALPQLIRNGDHTYLFWLRNDQEIRYIDVTHLIKVGINDDGTIKEDYELEAAVVFYPNSTPGQSPTYASYKAYVDKNDNLYVTWLQPVTGEDGKGAQEIFASAMISSADPNNVTGTSWSEGVQITDNGRFNDEHTFMIKGDGSVLLVNNQYDQDLSQEQGITNVQLVATDFTATGSVETIDISYEDAPLAAETTTVTCKVKNTGLKIAKGYTVEVYEVRDGIQGELIYTISETESLTPSSSTTVEFDWTLPEDFEGIEELLLRCVTKENEFEEIQYFDGEAIQIGPVYDLTVNEISQQDKGFVIQFAATNKGNQDYVASKGSDKVLVRYNNIHNTPEKEKIYLDLPMKDLVIGETKQYEAVLAIPDQDLVLGATAAYIEVEDGKDNIISNYKAFDIALEYPTSITVNNDATLNKITLKKGQKLTLAAQYAQAEYYPDGKIAYETDNNMIASVENGLISGNEIGSTTLNVKVLPYGGKKTLEVEVIANQNTDESESSPSVKPSTPTKPEPIKPDATKPTVDLKEEIEKTKENETITVTVIKENEAATVYLGAKDLVEMSKKNITLSVKSEGVAYNVPTSSIDIDKMLKQLGIASADQVVLKITIASPSKEEIAVVEKTAKDGNYELLLPPVDFSITASSADKAVEISTFKDYVERIIDIPEGVDTNKVITGMKFDKDGSAHHVPTKVFQKDGKWYASISSLTNSIYTLILKESSFVDTVGKWYENVVNEMAARMIVGGVGDGQFAGERQITRAEFAAMTVKALGLKTDGVHQFSDVSSDAWYSGAIGKAYEYGIVNGIGEGLFAPSEKITRQEAMAMIHNASKIAKIKEDGKSVNEKFADQGLVSDWAQEAVRYNVEKGLIVGNDGKLNPKEYISRAETATVLLRLLQKSNLVDVR